MNAPVARFFAYASTKSGRCVTTVSRPISFSPSPSAATLPSVSRSTLCPTLSTSARTVCVVCLRRYDLPRSSGFSWSQTTIASKRWVARGTFAGWTSMSPRLTSISSARRSVTDIGANATASSSP